MCIQVRSWCAVLMRKKLPVGDPTVFSKLDDRLCAAIKQELLNAVAGEPELGVRNQICDTLSEIAVICLLEEGICSQNALFFFFRT
jgi:hypothetical protein